MKIQSGSVYMTSIAEDTNVMGVVLKRMWWKPWRWKVTPIYYSEQRVNTAKVIGWSIRTDRGPTITNLSKEGAIGMAKLYGVRHRDFEDALYMRME